MTSSVERDAGAGRAGLGMARAGRHDVATGARPAIGARLAAVDLLRGIVMILMALDHVRDYFGNAGVDPTDMASTTPALFLTRWITHLCAPTFFLLAGTGAWLSRERRPDANLPRFLLSRGLWIVFLELTVFRFVVQLNVDYRVTLLITLWALGWSMVGLSFLVRLGTRATLGAGVLMILLHSAARAVPAQAFGPLAPLWMALFGQGPLLATPRVILFVGYPIVPWLGIMAVGYGLGPVLRWPPERRRATLLGLGAALLAAFVAVRAIDGWGDPRPWGVQGTTLMTVLSFLNATKQPPSVLFDLMTLGPALLLLALLDGRRRGRPVARAWGPVMTFGRVPMFYFVLHFLLVHLFAVVASAARYGAVHWMFESPSLDRYPITQPPGWPLPLPAIYALWVLVVAVSYPCCTWYAALKARHPRSLLRYL